MPQRFRLPVAVLAALAVAEVAVLLMRPRDRLEPVPVAPQTYFSAEQIEKAVDFRSGQLWLYGLRLAIELGVLILIVRRPPARFAHVFRRRPVLGGAAAAAAISVALTVVTLPVSAISRQRAIDVGLVTRSWPGWAVDVLQSTAIDAALVAAGGALLVFGMRRFGRNWWAPAAALVVGFGIAITLLSPIVLDPLFNRFTPLPRGELRSDVLALAERAGVDVGEVYSMDASKRTTAANAYVAGLGHTKRVVLYDNLIEDFSPDEVRLVVAHELGHQHYRDVPRGLLYLAIVAPLGHVRRRAAGGADGAAREPRHAGGGARGGARDRDHAAGDHDDLEPALARRRGARGPLLDGADRRAGRADRLPAPDRGPERLRPGPARLDDVPARHAPHDRAADRPGARRQD